MTINEAVRHTLPQLRLMSAAADRINAGKSLMDLDVAFSAAAPGWSKKGVSHLNKMRNSLRKASTNRGNRGGK